MERDRDLARQQEYVRIWKENGPLLDAIRDEEIRNANTIQSICMFEEAFRIAVRDFPPEPWSGLVEWQKYMMRWRERG